MKRVRASAPSNARYPKEYGAWAGNPKKPDYSRCCAVVHERWSGWSAPHQCLRKRGYGPDQAYCKQHDPAVAEAREQAKERRWNAQWNARRYEIHGRTFYEALEKIAAGHNDPRTLAQETIAEFKKGERE